MLHLTLAELGDHKVYLFNMWCVGTQDKKDITRETVYVQ